MKESFPPQPETPSESLAESRVEKLARRKSRVAGHLENIYSAERRFGALHTLSLQWLPKKQLFEGCFAALQVLVGAVAVKSGFLLRTREPLAGAVVTYHGADMLGKGTAKLLHEYVVRVSRTQADKRRGKKKKGEASEKESIGQYSVRTEMEQIMHATHRREEEFRAYRKAYWKMKEEGVISDTTRREAYRNYLKGFIGYLDRLIDGQTSMVQATDSPKGLARLSETLRDYHYGLRAHHQKTDDLFGTACAVGTLLGAQAQAGRSPLTVETVAALASGAVTVFGDMLERMRLKDSAQSSLEMFDQGLEGLRQLRFEKDLKLARLLQKDQRQKEVEHERAQQSGQAAAHSRAGGQEDFLDQFRAELGRIIHGAPEHMESFFSITLDERPPPIGSEPEELPQRSITPPSFEKIESSHLRREVDLQIICDLAEIAGRKLELSSGDVGWLDAPSAIRNIFVEDPHQDVSSAALDEAVRYLGELDDRLTAHQSVRDFQQFHLAGLVELRRDIEAKLYLRERAAQRDLIVSGSTAALRAAILRRSRIADFSDDIIETISQEQFEEGIRQWMQRKSTREHDRVSLRKFLEACHDTLKTIPDHLSFKGEKAHSIKRANDVLDEFLPEVAMPDPEQVALWDRRIDEIAALFNRIRFSPTYDERQHVPELLAGEPFVPSDVLREITFAKGDLGDMKLKSVDTKAVVGSYVDREAWIVKDRAAIAELAAPLVNTPTPEVLKKFFMSEVVRGARTHLEENIQLLRIPGPKGPLYFAYRGIQHIAAARVAGLPRIVARVYELRSRDLLGNKIVHTKYRDRYEEWLVLKDAGLIDGEFVSAQDLKDRYAWFKPEGSDREETLVPIEAKIRFQSVPWLCFFQLKPHYGMPMRSILEISRLYNKLYSPFEGSTETGPLDKLKKVDGTKLNPLTLTRDSHFHTFVMSKGKRLA